LASDEIDGAMQHAPHPGRQIIGAAFMQIGLSRMGKGCRFHFFPFFPVDRKTPKSGAKGTGFKAPDCQLPNKTNTPATRILA
jgi:hypothetical protein